MGPFTPILTRYDWKTRVIGCVATSFSEESSASPLSAESYNSHLTRITVYLALSQVSATAQLEGL